MTANKLLATPAHNSFIDTWDQPLNANFVNIDEAFGNYTTLNATGLSGTIALTNSQCVPLGFIVTGTPVGSVNYQTPAGVGGLWPIRNRATLGVSITVGFSSASGGATVDIPAATNVAVSADGTVNGMNVIDTRAPAAGGSIGQVQVNIAGFLGGYAGFTFDGTTLDVPNIVASGTSKLNLTTDSTAITQPSLTNNTTPATTQYADNNLIQFLQTPVTTQAPLTGVYNTASGAPFTTANGTPVSGMSAVSFTPKSTNSKIEMSVALKGTPSSNEAVCVAAFNGSVLLDFYITPVTTAASVQYVLGGTTWFNSPGTSPQNFNVRIGGNTGGTWFLNQANTGGGITGQTGATSYLVIKEFLPRP